MKFDKKIVYIIGFILFVIMSVCLCFTIKKFDSKTVKTGEPMNLNFKNRVEDIKNTKLEDYTVAGWIEIQGTNIDYPVFTSEVTHDTNFFETFEYAYKYDDNDSYKMTYIGGHNIINVSNSPIRDLSKLSRFEALMLFSYLDFAKENLYVKYTTYDGEEKLYKIYAVGFYDDVNFDSNVSNYIKNAKKNSIFKYDVDVNKDDELLILNTCTRYYGKDTKDQFVVDARLVRKDEEILKYNVSK